MLIWNGCSLQLVYVPFIYMLIWNRVFLIINISIHFIHTLIHITLLIKQVSRNLMQLFIISTALNKPIVLYTPTNLHHLKCILEVTSQQHILINASIV